MPELPEVEMVRLQLQKYLVGHTITDITVNWRNSFKGNKNDVKGAKIISVGRLGKVVVIKLDNGSAMLMHLKMTGQPIYRGPNLRGKTFLSKKVLGGIPGKHTQIEISLDRKGRLYFNDVRKFGWIKLIKSDKLASDKFIDKLGPEPFITKSSSGQVHLTLKIFKDIISKTSRPIKVLLMDQSKISGVGNIYANDALFLARVNPRRKADDLSGDESKKLLRPVEKVLKQGLSDGGASENAFVTPDGREGRYQNNPLVYNREGEPCKRCKTKIEKFKLGGRGTYWCPTCQV